MLASALLHAMLLAGAQTAGTPTTPEQTAAQLGSVPRCVIPPVLNLSDLLSRIKQPTKEDLAAASMRRTHELFPKVGCKEGSTK